MLKTGVLIVAAGRGHRMNSDVPKQYMKIGEKTIIRHTIDTFLNHASIDCIKVVIHRNDEKHYKKAIGAVAILPPVFGGKTRQESVRIGLESLVANGLDLVLIHDAARPHIDENLISKILDNLENFEAVIPALPIVDALKNAESGIIKATVDRQKFFRAQTPQGFHFDSIFKAHNDFVGHDVNDDSELAELSAIDVKLIEGTENNVKITYLEDLKKHSSSDEHMHYETRVGFGLDVHEFEPGHELLVCGVKIPFNKALKGHSDADVGLHALTDALFGAMGAGDIGEHFPPSDPKWLNKSSAHFLSYANSFIKEANGIIMNIDLTLVCEKPKITKYKTKMRSKISEILNIPEARINIKATTTERLGFLGRGEGICAQAIVSVNVKYHNKSF